MGAQGHLETPLPSPLPHHPSIKDYQPWGEQVLHMVLCLAARCSEVVSVLVRTRLALHYPQRHDWGTGRLVATMNQTAFALDGLRTVE